MPNRGLLTLEQLRVEVEAERIDTVLIVVTDMQGRLQGKRLSARYFLEEVVGARLRRAATTCSRSTST